MRGVGSHQQVGSDEGRSPSKAENVVTAQGWSPVEVKG